MPVCQYFGQLNCTAPTFGGSTSPSAVSGGPNGTLLITAPPPSLFDQYFGSNHLIQVLNIILYVLIIRYIIWPFIIVPILSWLNYRRLKQTKGVLLELTPPLSNLKSPEATTEFFTSLHGLTCLQSSVNRGPRAKSALSLEIVSDRSSGIRYLVRLSASSVAAFQQYLSAYLPEVQFKEVDDYLPLVINNNEQAKALIEYQQTRSFAFPLRPLAALSRHDPVAYLVAAMSQPAPDETLALQLILSPYRSRQALKIRNKLLQNKQPHLSELSVRLASKRSTNPHPLVFLALSLTSVAFNKDNSSGKFSSTPLFKPGLGSTIQPVKDRIVAKLGEPLFFADLRACMVASTPEQVETRVIGLTSALASFSEPGYQQLVSSTSLLPPCPPDYWIN